MEAVPVAKGLNLGQATHEGMSGKHNEDNFGVFAWKLDGRRDLHLGVVADGVGGQIAGEVASRMTVKAIQEYFDRLERIDDVSAHLEEAILSANRAVYEASQRNPAYRGMSTTVAVVALVGDRLYTAHVGDSRIYLFRDGRLRQLSIDHSWAQEAIDAGLITREEAKSHPNRNVIRRHLGGKPQVEVDHRMVLEPGQSAAAARANQGTAVRSGDTLLICSDGLTDMIDDEAVLETLRDHFDDLALAAQELIAKANQAGGRDNITVVLMQATAERLMPAEATVAATTMVAETLSVEQVESPAAATVVAPVTAERRSDSGGRQLRLMLAGGVVALIAMAVAIGLFLVFGGALREDDAPVRQLTAVPTTEAPAPLSTKEAAQESGDAPTKERTTPASELPSDAPAENPGGATRDAAVEASKVPAPGNPSGTPEPAPSAEPTEERTDRS